MSLQLTCNDINKSEKHIKWKRPAIKCVIPFVWSSVIGEVMMNMRTWHFVVSTQVFCPFCFKLDWLSFHCWVTRVLYIFWVQVFCQMYTYWKYFLPPVGYSLHLLMMSFNEQKFTFFMKSNLSVFNRQFFKSSFRLTAKLSWKYEWKVQTVLPHTGIIFLPSTSPTRTVHLLQSTY